MAQVESSVDRFGDDFGAERMWGLQELPLPEPVSFFPQTPGWWAVAGIVVALTGWWAWRRYRRWQAQAYRREALAQLGEISARPERFTQLSFVLRRAALSAYPRIDVASLRGEGWVGWLNGTAGRELFSVADAELLDRLAYVSDEQVRAIADTQTTARLIASGTAWLRVHCA